MRDNNGDYCESNGIIVSSADSGWRGTGCSSGCIRHPLDSDVEEFNAAVEHSPGAVKPSRRSAPGDRAENRQDLLGS